MTKWVGSSIAAGFAVFSLSAQTAVAAEGLSCQPQAEADEMMAAVKDISWDILPYQEKYIMRGNKNRPKINITGKNADGTVSKTNVTLGPGKTSHCTIATGTVLMQYLSNKINSGKLKLTEAQVKTMATANGPIYRAANGDSNSIAMLNAALGGSNFKGSSKGTIRKALESARPGDVVKTYRRVASGRKYGHAMIFDKIEGDQYCYYTSSSATNGFGRNCEPISRLEDIVVSQFPSNDQLQKNLPALLDGVQNGPKTTAEEVLASDKNVESVSTSKVASVKPWNEPGSCKVAEAKPGPTVEPPAKKEKPKQETVSKEESAPVRQAASTPVVKKAKKKKVAAPRASRSRARNNSRSSGQTANDIFMNNFQGGGER